MKAVRVTAQRGGTFDIAPLPLPTVQRKGAGDSASNMSRQPCDALRAIVLSDGPFKGLAAQPGSLLTFVVSGDLTLSAGQQSCALAPGDILLTDDPSASKITLDVRNQGRLLQVVVPSNWPQPDAKVQQPGTFIPRPGPTPKLKRLYEGKDGKAYFTEFRELFPDIRNRWSEPRPASGFRMISRETGETDWHPSGNGHLGFLSCGDMEVEVGGGGGAIEHFYAGDLSLAEDFNGQGHIVRAHGYIHLTNIHIELENLWPYKL